MPEFDLADVATVRSDDGVPMTVVHPKSRQPITHDDGSLMTITLLGRSSEAFREILRQIQINRAEIANRRQVLTDDDVFLEDTQTLVACTADWSIRQLDGQPFPANPQNIRKLWGDTRFRWLRERALQFILEDGNFLPLASTNSRPTRATTSDLQDLSPAVGD